jgi:predicted lipoprotein with Yx(FWY)xxD motif
VRGDSYGACAQGWPPLTGKATAGPCVSANKLGTVRRRDGKTQVTYNGHPLYRHNGDSGAGQTNGEGSKVFGAGWYVVSPSGNKIDKS